MVKNLKAASVTHIVIFILAIGLIGTGLIGVGPAFALWPFSSEEESTLININTADEDTLAALPGIGEAKAKAIIDYRQKNGPFKTVEEVKNVPGIEEQVFAGIKEKITVEEGEKEAQLPAKESSVQSQAAMPEEEKE